MYYSKRKGKKYWHFRGIQTKHTNKLEISLGREFEFHLEVILALSYLRSFSWYFFILKKFALILNLLRKSFSGKHLPQQPTNWRISSTGRYRWQHQETWDENNIWHDSPSVRKILTNTDRFRNLVDTRKLQKGNKIPQMDKSATIYSIFK